MTTATLDLIARTELLEDSVLEKLDLTAPVTVFTKKPCPQCDATIRELDKKGVDYVLSPITEENTELFRASNLLSAPVVVTPHGAWGGFSPDKINELAKRMS